MLDRLLRVEKMLSWLNLVMPVMKTNCSSASQIFIVW